MAARSESFEVRPEEAGLRLDGVLLAHFPDSTRAFCRQAVAAGHATVNGRPALKGLKVRAGDQVTVCKLKTAADHRARPDPKLQVRVVYEDDWLIAADKPAGMAVQPLSGDEHGALMNGLVARYPELASIGDQPLMAGALHRIDIGTSGLVLAARTAAAFEAMRAQFARREVEKIYLALVEGHVALPARWVHDLAHDPGHAACRMVDARTLPPTARRLRAESACRPLERIGPYTLLEVTIRTGVTHQIRCQLALAGQPIVNDARYGARPVPGCARHYLHALEVRFMHPGRQTPCRICAPLAQDFEAFLGMFAPGDRGKF